MSVLESLNIPQLGRSMLSPEFFFATIAMAVFWMTIVQPESILPQEADQSARNAILYSPQCLIQAKSMEPARLLAEGKPDRALVTAEELALRSPHDPLSNLVAGNVLVEIGQDLDKGLSLLKKSVALEPRSRWVRLNYAEKLAEKKRYEEAIAQYQLISKGYPRWTKPRIALAQIYFKMDRPAQAADELKEALVIEPNDFQARKLRGIALARSGQTRRGLEEYFLGDATEQNFQGLPDDLKTAVKQWGTIERAIHGARLELQDRPDDASVKLRLGRLLMYTGNVKEARQYLLEARKAAPASVDVHRNLALALQRLGETNQALSEFLLSINLERSQEKAREL